MMKEDKNLSLPQKAAALMEGELDIVANMANISALLFESLADINWAGFYVFKEGVLVLGPFQGRPACVRIAIGKGVCGAAAQKRETLVVPDVHAFPGHIACDSASKSEIVVPVLRGDGSLFGVLDIDAPVKNRFCGADKEMLEGIVRIFAKACGL